MDEYFSMFVVEILKVDNVGKCLPENEKKKQHEIFVFMPWTMIIVCTNTLMLWTYFISFYYYHYYCLIFAALSMHAEQIENKKKMGRKTNNKMVSAEDTNLTWCSECCVCICVCLCIFNLKFHQQLSNIRWNIRLDSRRLDLNWMPNKKFSYPKFETTCMNTWAHEHSCFRKYFEFMLNVEPKLALELNIRKNWVSYIKISSFAFRSVVLKLFAYPSNNGQKRKNQQLLPPLLILRGNAYNYSKLLQKMGWNSGGTREGDRHS